MNSPFQKLLSEPNRNMNKLFYSLMKSDEKNSEYEQGLYRVIFTGLILAYWLFNYTNGSNKIIESCSMYLVVSVIFFASIIANPAANKKRQWLSMIMDVALTSYGFYLTNEVGGILIGIYLWLIVGYGLRYGQALLRGTHVAGLLGFCIAVYFSNFWHMHMHIVYGFLVTLLLVPLHTQNLLQQLKLAIDRAELASQAKSQFLSHISHEIRTPLNGIVGACDVMTTTNLDKEQKSLFEIMKSSSELLAELVNNVLDLSKIESGKMTIHPANFNLESLIDKTIGLFKNQCNQKKIELSYEIDPDAPLHLRSDPLHIKQVLINLLSNAIKFTDKGSVKLKISTLVETESKVKLRFEIIDTGIGIHEKSLNSIFDSFSQADSSIKYRYGGTGLGTTISKQLVVLMGGFIGVESKVGEGSKFWFEIPLEKQTLVESQEEISLIKENSGVISFQDYYDRNSQKRALRLLVADDNLTNRTILSKMLEQYGHEVHLAEDGDEALDLLERHQFDLMILDCNMPNVSGLEVIKLNNLLSLGKPRIPAIILSADATTHSKQLAQEVGADAYLTKPLDSVLLLETINKLGNNASGNFKMAEILPYSKKIIVESRSNEQLVNQSRLNELTKLDRNDRFFENMLNGFIIETESKMEIFDNYLEAKDFTNLNHLGHAIAGSAASIGLDKMVIICQKIDAIKPSDDIDYVKDLVKEAQITFELSKPQLLDYLHKYQMASM